MRSFRSRFSKTHRPPAVIPLLAFTLAVSEPAGTAAEIRQAVGKRGQGKFRVQCGGLVRKTGY
ncbi:MAG: hypothetical protein AB1700_18240 [Bacillota bacterium]